MSFPQNLVPVWAPYATQLQVKIGEEVRPMKAAEDGWWVADSPLSPGTEYAYLVNGEGPFPNPRSWYQPHGVHGPSKLVELPKPAPFHCEKLIDKVFYELHLGTFTPSGTFAAAAEKLPYLKDLGIEVVSLMPLAQSPGKFGWGYDGVGLYAPYNAYGTPQDFANFVTCAHKQGLAVCVDLVLNHLGPEGNYLSKFGPYFSPRHHTPWGEGYNLDGPDCQPVRQFLIGAALHLLSAYAVDALRLDAIHAIADDSKTHLLAELSDQVDKLSQQTGRTYTLIAECDLNDAKILQPTSSGGLGLDMQWDDDLHHAIHALFTHESQGYYGDFATTGAFEKAFESVFLHDGCYSSFRGRNWGHPVPPDLDRRRFMVFAANHDQVGNRALGDRPIQKIGADLALAEGILVLLCGYTPLLFMGEEFGATTPFQFFADYEDSALRQAVATGRTHEFAAHGWEKIYGTHLEVPNPVDHKTFTSSKIDWQQAQGPQAKTFMDFYRQAIALRKKLPVSTKSPSVHLSSNLLTVSRPGLRYFCNLGEADASIAPADLRGFTVALSNGWDASRSALASHGFLVATADFT